MNDSTRLRRIRMERKLSQRKLARELGMSQGAYWKIENGKMKLTTDRLIALCRFYHLSADYLIGLTDKE